MARGVINRTFKRKYIVQLFQFIIHTCTCTLKTAYIVVSTFSERIDFKFFLKYTYLYALGIAFKRTVTIYLRISSNINELMLLESAYSIIT